MVSLPHLVDAAAFGAAWAVAALMLVPVSIGVLFVTMVAKAWREERARDAAARALLRDRVPVRWLSEMIPSPPREVPGPGLSGVRRAVAGLAIVAVAGLVLSPLLSEVSTQDAGSYSGVLLGATASAIGVVFVFVFALVEATLSGREARSVATFTEVLHQVGATWTLGLSCLALGLNGLALTISFAGGFDEAPIPWWLRWLTASAATATFGALIALVLSVVRTIHVLAPGELSRRFRSRIRGESAAAVEHEVNAHRLGAELLSVLKEWRDSQAALPVDSVPFEPEGRGLEIVFEAIPADHDREIVDIDLHRLYTAALAVVQLGGALAVRQPAGGVLRPEDTWLGSSTAAGDTPIGQNPYRLERAEEQTYRDMLLTAYQRAIASIRMEDPVGLDDAMRHIEGGLEGVIAGHRKTRQRGDEAYWMSDSLDGVLHHHIDRLRGVWSRVDRDLAEWDLVSPVASAWLRMASEALSALDDVALTRLMDEFSASARRRFGQGGTVPGMMVETLLLLSRRVAHRVGQAARPGDLDALEPVVASLLQGWCGAVLAALDAADPERYEWLLSELSRFAREPGFRCDHAARDTHLADGVESPDAWVAAHVAMAKRKLAYCRGVEDSHLLIRFAAVAKVARDLTVNPRRQLYGRPPLGPTSRESIGRFVRTAVAGIEDLARGSRIASDTQFVPQWVLRVAERPWGRIEDMGHPASFFQDAPAGFFLGGLHLTSPEARKWGTFAENDDLKRLRALGKVHPGYLHERAADLHGWSADLLPERPKERAVALMKATTSGPHVFHPPYDDADEAPPLPAHRTLGRPRPPGNADR